MKRLLIFGVSFALGMGILLHFAGDIRSTVKSAAKPIVRHVDPARAPTTAGHRISVDGRTIEAVEGLVQTAPPERIIWKDKLSDEVIEIPVFFPWRFRANDLVGTQPADADTQGVVCTNVRMLLYRQPETRAEAVALRSGDKEAYEALLNQTFSADEARVFGRLGEALNRNKTQRGAARLGDTKLILSGNVHVVDIAQGFDVRGEPTTEVTVWPEQGRAEGRGPFTMTHEAFKLTGEGLSMEQNKDAGWADVDILRNPVLRIHSDVHDADGKPMFNFGGGDFKPTHVVSRGKASLHRETNRRDTILKITFFDKVRAEQQGGRSLDAGRVELLASQPIVPRNGAASSGWQLQYFLAEERVAVEYPGKTRKGEAYLASITSNRLFHEIPEDGSHATTELTGDVVMNMRGEIPVLGPGGRLRATCRDSATIGPLRQGSPTGGHEFDLLQEISLRGEAVIERTESGLALAKDTLEGDAIDLVVLPKDTKGGIGSAGDEGSSGMIAIHFAARGNVRLGGTRINGNTHRLIGEALDTDRPRILAEGPGTHFAFPNLGSNQRLLGPGEQPQDAPATNNGGFGAVPEEETEDKGKWLLHRLLATGLVDIDTSLGGPAIGIPAQVSGDELSYSRVSQQAQVIGKGGRQARIAWTAPTGEISHLETRTLTMDQSQGRITADGGVAGEFYGSRDGLGGSPFPSGREAEAGTAPSELSVRTDARIEVELVRMSARAGKGTGRASVDGDVAASCDLMFVIVDPDEAG